MPFLDHSSRRIRKTHKLQFAFAELGNDNEFLITMSCYYEEPIFNAACRGNEIETMEFISQCLVGKKVNIIQEHGRVLSLPEFILRLKDMNNCNLFHVIASEGRGYLMEDLIGVLNTSKCPRIYSY